MKLIVTITGPSLVGKSTLEKKLCEKGFAPVVSMTSRRPRVGEVDGVNYHFVTDDKFVELMKKNAFVETNRFNDAYYGVPISELTTRESVNTPAVVAVVDPNGKTNLYEWARRNDWAMVSVFLNARSEVLAYRFIQRFVNDAIVLAKGDASDHEKAMSVASRRLTEMLGQERDWVRHGLKDNAPYDLVVANYEPNDEEALIKLILAQGKEKLAALT